MKLNAYILAADPNWIEASVASYYSVIDKLYVSYDIDGLSWSGTDISKGIQETRERLKKIDKEGKIVEIAGSFSRFENPRIGETKQREAAINAASEGADWIFQFDSDEVIPNVNKVISILSEQPENIKVVYWPMRSFYNITPDGRFLEICNRFGSCQAEYPGSIAVRAGAKLDAMRHVYSGENHLYIQLLRWPPRINKEVPLKYHITPRDAILHISWVRSPQALKSKLASWGHSDQVNPETAYNDWANAATNWRSMRNFHPMHAHLWPRLRVKKLPYKADW